MITTPVKQWRRQKHVIPLIGKEGVLVQWTIIRTPPKLFSQEAPYPLVIVQMESGKKMIGQLVDWESEDLQKGKKVVAVLRKASSSDKEGVVTYTIKFKPNE